MQNFRELEIWHQGLDLTVIAYEMLKQFPKEETYGLIRQIKRASVSVVSNIAEGCSRSSQREFKHFLKISLGSSFEVETDFLVSERLNMIREHQLSDFLSRLHVHQKKTNALVSKIKYS